MNRYDVTLRRSVNEVTHVYIDAKDEDEACKKAEREIEQGGKFEWEQEKVEEPDIDDVKLV